MHPYQGIPARQSWRRATEGWPRDLYAPKFPITRGTRIATGGSCFAQHIGRHLRARGYNFLDFESAPALLPAELHAAYGYGLYSARYGNIYSSRQLLHLTQAACGSREIEEVWARRGRFADPMRPAIEPAGFGSAEEVRRLREAHLVAVRRMMEEAEVFVFTFGLTETWHNAATGLTYPMCPGTVAGRFKPERHRFHNLRYPDVLSDMEEVIALWRGINPAIRLLLTVSPVSLAATAEDRHVVASSTYSKSVLRAVAGDLSAAHPFVDYFPSYEIVTAPPARARGWARDLREVTPEAVEALMAAFFAAHGDDGAPMPEEAPVAVPDAAALRRMETICEEARLDADGAG